VVFSPFIGRNASIATDESKRITQNNPRIWYSFNLTGKLVIKTNYIKLLIRHKKHKTEKDN